MENKIVEWMQELLDAHEWKNQTSSWASKEILYWRNRFLDSLTVLDDPNQEQRKRAVFSHIPTLGFTCQTPEWHIEETLKEIRENK
jgi:hypothetical protein